MQLALAYQPRLDAAVPRMAAVYADGSFARTSSWLLTNEVRYVYDGSLVVQERDSNNIPCVTYSRGLDLSGGFQSAGGIGGLLARTDNALMRRVGSSALQASAFYHADGNGNITMMVDALQNVVARYQYDPYGNILFINGSLADANTYRFSSKEWDSKTGDYHYHFREYTPSLHRWRNADPVGEYGGVNLYGFVHNRPMDSIDPLGLFDAPNFDQGAANWQTRVDGCKATVNQSITTDFGALGATLLNTMMDVGNGTMQFVAAIPHIGGENTYRFAQNPSWENSPYLLKDINTSLGVALFFAPGIQPLASEMSTMRVNGPPSTVAAKGPVRAFEVGTADDLLARSVKNDKLDIHHVGQAHPFEQIISDYNRGSAPAIAVPRAQHTTIPTVRGQCTATARDQLAKDIRDLRNYTDAPNSSLRELIDLNKQKYPNALQK
ncbi:MAG: RHS repeat-associated core domain-containing protein [Verrucomicrobiota bacterium]